MKNSLLLKKGFDLVKDYFLHADDRHIAWFLYIGALSCIVALTGLSFVFSWWYVAFWAAIMAKDLGLFILNIEIFGGLIAGYVGVNVLKNYWTDLLTIRWRTWLTEKFVQNYLAKNNYLNLSRTAKNIDNPAQRIQEEIDSFVNLSLILSLEFLNSVSRLIVFSGTLWVVGGAFTFALLGTSITIPGYLFWCAVLFALTASFITKKIGRSLATYTNEQKSLEATFRKNLDFVQNQSENIAQQKGEPYHQRTLLSQLKKMANNTYDKILVRLRLVTFENFYLQAALIFPTVITAPLFFKDKLGIGQFMQISNAFGEIQFALNWFIGSFETLTNYRTTIKRLVELQDSFETSNHPNANIKVVEKAQTNEIEVAHLNIAKPTSSEFILKNLNVTFKKGENTLITGDSGLGKSTLAKVLGKTWPHGEGNIQMCDSRDIFFLSQQSLLPKDTLKAVLAYPETVDTYTADQYQQVLTLVGLSRLNHQLDESNDWAQRLSGGEQQRLSFARALLKKPKWLFLDEITSSLDTANERQLYQLIKQHAKDTTYISIAHKASVAEFHDRIISLRKDTTGQTQLRDERLFSKASNEENAEDIKVNIPVSII